MNDQQIDDAVRECVRAWIAEAEPITTAGAVAVLRFDIRALALRVRDAEQERCAKIADDYDGDGLTTSGYDCQLGDARQTMKDIAAAIRAPRTEREA